MLALFFQMRLILVGAQHLDRIQIGVVSQWEQSIGALRPGDFSLIALPMELVVDVLVGIARNVGYTGSTVF